MTSSNLGAFEPNNLLSLKDSLLLLSYQHFKFERKRKRVGKRIDLLQKKIF
jgi:hypothetical protein